MEKYRLVPEKNGYRIVANHNFTIYLPEHMFRRHVLKNEKGAFTLNKKPLSDDDLSWADYDSFIGENGYISGDSFAFGSKIIGKLKNHSLAKRSTVLGKVEDMSFVEETTMGPSATIYNWSTVKRTNITGKERVYIARKSIVQDCTIDSSEQKICIKNTEINRSIIAAKECELQIAEQDIHVAIIETSRDFFKCVIGGKIILTAWKRKDGDRDVVDITGINLTNREKIKTIHFSDLFRDLFDYSFCKKYSLNPFQDIVKSDRKTRKEKVADFIDANIEKTISTMSEFMSLNTNTIKENSEILRVKMIIDLFALFYNESEINKDTKKQIEKNLIFDIQSASFKGMRPTAIVSPETLAYLKAFSGDKKQIPDGFDFLKNRGLIVPRYCLGGAY